MESEDSSLVLNIPQTSVAVGDVLGGAVKVTATKFGAELNIPTGGLFKLPKLGLSYESITYERGPNGNSENAKIIELEETTEYSENDSVQLNIKIEYFLKMIEKLEQDKEILEENLRKECSANNKLMDEIESLKQMKTRSDKDASRRNAYILKRLNDFKGFTKPVTYEEIALKAKNQRMQEAFAKIELIKNKSWQIVSINYQNTGVSDSKISLKHKLMKTMEDLDYVYAYGIEEIQKEKQQCKVYIRNLLQKM